MIHTEPRPLREILNELCAPGLLLVREGQQRRFEELMAEALEAYARAAAPAAPLPHVHQWKVIHSVTEPDAWGCYMLNVGDGKILRHVPSTYSECECGDSLIAPAYTNTQSLRTETTESAPLRPESK